MSSRILRLSLSIHKFKLPYQSRDINVGIIGAGRIGRVHAESVIRAGAKAVVISDINAKAAKETAEKFGIPKWVTQAEDVVGDPQVDAVLICSPTHAHADQIELAAKNRKHIFCEKPVHLELDVINYLIPKVKSSGVKLMLGYNRRFDANFKRIKSAILSGEIGNLHYLRITSRDPNPPPIDYVKHSGGIFCDMMIHDFDMARFLVGEEVDEVYATGSCLINPEIGKAGDVDSAVCLLKFKSGITTVIENSRQAVYGYDQRIEAFGSNGIALADNNYPNNVIIGDGKRMQRDLPLNFFLERYMDAYTDEIKSFIDSITQDLPVSVDVEDGRKSIILGIAAGLSLKENRVVKINEISEK